MPANLSNCYSTNRTYVIWINIQQWHILMFLKHRIEHEIVRLFIAFRGLVCSQQTSKVMCRPEPLPIMQGELWTLMNFATSWHPSSPILLLYNPSHIVELNDRERLLAHLGCGIWSFTKCRKSSCHLQDMQEHSHALRPYFVLPLIGGGLHINKTTLALKRGETTFRNI